MNGQRLRHYEKADNRGQGSVGVAYQPRDTHLDRFVAIKLLPPSGARQAAKVLSAFGAPALVCVHASAPIGTSLPVDIEETAVRGRRSAPTDGGPGRWTMIGNRSQSSVLRFREVAETLKGRSYGSFHPEQVDGGRSGCPDTERPNCGFQRIYVRWLGQSRAPCPRRTRKSRTLGRTRIPHRRDDRRFHRTFTGRSASPSRRYPLSYAVPKRTRTAHAHQRRQSAVLRHAPLDAAAGDARRPSGPRALRGRRSLRRHRRRGDRTNHLRRCHPDLLPHSRQGHRGTQSPPPANPVRDARYLRASRSAASPRDPHLFHVGQNRFAPHKRQSLEDRGRGGSGDGRRPGGVQSRRLR